MNPDDSFTYTPNPDFSGGDSFTYEISDGRGGFDTATVTIQIAPVSEAPQALNDEANVTEEVFLTATGNVLSNDTDPDGDPLTVSQVAGNAANVGVVIAGLYGTLQLDSNGTYIYILDNTNVAVQALNDGQILIDSFTYRSHDGTSDSNEATLNITIHGLDDIATFNFDPDHCPIAWSLFASQPDANGVGFMTGTFEGITSSYLFFKIDGNFVFYDDGTGLQPILFHPYGNIVDVLIGEALSSGSAFYDVSNIRPNIEANTTFDPNDPINTYYFYDDFDTSTTGSAGPRPTYIDGTSGNDGNISGNNNGDILIGDAGVDTLIGNKCDDYLHGGLGNDTLQGSEGNDILVGDAGDDDLNGSGDNDLLLGGEGADTLNGGPGNDILYGGIDADQDILDGGPGADLYVFAVDEVGGQLRLLSDGDIIKSMGNSDSLGFLDYSTNGTLAAGDTNQNFLLDLDTLTSHVTFETGDFSGNSQTDLRMNFNGGGSIIFETFSDTNILNTLFTNNLIQVIDANG